MLVLDQVTLHYPGRAPLRFPDFRLQAGEQALLLGPSGAGKSSLLQLIAGLQRPSAGRVMVDGAPISEWSEARRDRFRGQRIGMVFQRLHLVGALTVRQNLRLARSCCGLPPDEARIDELLERLGLGALGEARPHQLSGGQQQRVAIARALLNQPAVVLADEPTASLDDAHAEAVLDLLTSEARQSGAALLVATHDARAKARFEQRWELAA